MYVEIINRIMMLPQEMRVKKGEHKSFSITFHFEDDVAGYNKYIDIKYNDNKLQRLIGNANDDECEFDFEDFLTAGNEILFELVCKKTISEDETLVWKTLNKGYVKVENAINADVDVDNPTVADVIDQIQDEVEDLDDEITTHEADNTAHGLNTYLVKNIVAGDNITITNNNGVFTISGEKGGASLHNSLGGRDAENCHPMSAITGLLVNNGKINNNLINIDNDTIKVNSDGKLYATAGGGGGDDTGTQIEYVNSEGANQVILVDNLTNINYIRMIVNATFIHPATTLVDYYYKETELRADFKITSSSDYELLTPVYSETYGTASGNAIDFQQNITCNGNSILYNFSLPNNDKYTLYIKSSKITTTAITPTPTTTEATGGDV